MSALKAVIAGVVVAVTCAGCGGTGAVDIEAGWQWEVDSWARLSLDAEFDWLTGELTYPAESGGTGLALPSVAAATEAELDEARSEAAARLCKDYAEPWGDDPMEAQGREIRAIMFSTTRAMHAKHYSEAYLAAYRETEAYVDANGPSLDDLEYGTSAWDKASADRSDLWVSHWDELYGELDAEYERLSTAYREIATAVNSSATVRAIQEMYIAKCQLTVAPDYRFPSPAELGIDVDQDYLDDMQGS